VLSRFEPSTRRRIRQRLNRTLQPAWLGTLRRTQPLSRNWGYDRGTPVDRYYIEQFLQRRRDDIRGRVLEVKDATYTSRFGHDVNRCDLIDNQASNRMATIVADLANAESIPGDTFDCCVITQTLQYVWDVGAAARELHRILRPGGVLLATVPAITHLDVRANFPDYWRFTPDSCARLFEPVFGRERVLVEAYGNVLTSIALLSGIAREELSQAELDACDRDFPLVVCIRAVKGAP